VQELLYIGSLLLTSLLMLATRVYIQRHPELHSIPEERLGRGMRGAIALSILFALALVLAVAIPVVNYWAMFVLLLAAPLSKLLAVRSKRNAHPQ
jgi:hypothetical protein